MAADALLRVGLAHRGSMVLAHGAGCMMMTDNGANASVNRDGESGDARAARRPKLANGLPMVDPSRTLLQVLPPGIRALAWRGQQLPATTRSSQWKAANELTGVLRAHRAGLRDRHCLRAALSAGSGSSCGRKRRGDYLARVIDPVFASVHEACVYMEAAGLNTPPPSRRAKFLRREVSCQTSTEVMKTEIHSPSAAVEMDAPVPAWPMGLRPSC